MSTKYWIGVEGKEDKALLKALSENLFPTEKFEFEIYSTDESVTNPGNVIEGFKKLIPRLNKGLFQKNKIGIVMDADKLGVQDRAEQVKNAANAAWGITSAKETISSNTDFVVDVSGILQIRGYVTGVGGIGELENLLREIALKNTGFGECLDEWKKCFEGKNLSIREKEFQKQWLYTYLRFDFCNESQRKQAGKHCTLEAALEAGNYFDLHHLALNELKKYLNSF